MSNKVIVVWGFLVISLLATFFVIGTNYKKNREYIEATDEIKIATKEYIKNYELKISETPTVINSNDLISNYLLDEIVIKNKPCNADISISKKYYVFNDIKVDIKCDEVNENTEQDA